MIEKFKKFYVSKYRPKDENRVFRWTSQELQARIDVGEGERIPQLEELIILCQDSPNMLLNIELKGPLDPHTWGLEYDYDLAAEQVIKLINKYDISGKTMISSFVPQIISSVLKASPKPVPFMVQSLRNRWGAPDALNYETLEGASGININFDYLRDGRCAKVHNDEKYIGVFYS